MKRFLNRRNDRRSARRSDIVPELISRYGMQLLDNISRLRDKIGTEHIATIRGTGYRWEE